MERAQKEQLGYLLGKGHTYFSKVAPRRPYREDDDEGGAGTPELALPEHPLLNQRPVGASSDMTAIATDNRDTLEAAEERAADACPELQKQPALQRALGKGLSHTYTAPPPTLVRR